MSKSYHSPLSSFLVVPGFEVEGFTVLWDEESELDPEGALSLKVDGEGARVFNFHLGTGEVENHPGLGEEDREKLLEWVFAQLPKRSNREG